MPAPPREDAADAAAEASGSGPDASLPSIPLKKVAWPLLLSILVLLVIGYFTFDVQSFQKVAQQVRPWPIAVALATVVLRVFFGAWRLSYVSKGRLSLTDGVRTQLAWDFFSNVTPSTIGGGPIAAAYISRDCDVSLGESTSIIFFSMLLDQLWFALSVPFIFAATFYFEVIPPSVGTLGTWAMTGYFSILLLWSFVFGYATLFRPVLLEKLVDRVCRVWGLRRFRARALRETQRLKRRARVLRSQPPSFYVKGFLLTFGTWINRYVLIVFILWSVYPQLDVVLAFLRSVALKLGSLILPTPGGSGGLEGLYAVFFSAPFIPEALVAPTLLVWRFLGYYIFVALGIFLSMHHLQKTIRRRQHPPEASRLGERGGRQEPAVASLNGSGLAERPE